MITKRRAAVAVVVCLLTASGLSGLSGCARDGGAVDGGAAPSITPPPVAVPLWPSSAPSAFPDAPGAAVREPESITVPLSAPDSGDLRDVSPQAIVLADRVPGEEMRARVRGCPADCGLREPMYRDLTGDGHVDLLVAVDEPSGRTGLLAYTLLDGRIAHILGVEDFLTGIDTLGADVVTHERLYAASDPVCCPSLQYSTRYRWNGRELNPIVLQTEGGADQCKVAPKPKAPIPNGPAASGSAPGGPAPSGATPAPATTNRNGP
ncbi:hypothetical protein [Streptomyces sp. SID3343]|uniref:hypothetical protein n=1 Tax=Streptomyces sp. SID3343 TaxID=2690260 RepID=UPI001370A027|nr:hypothetical protein [Streptomyces sp. SID3343]MYV96741.1 hypothetical protein [Streptomyces sp. SID3343]